MSEFKRTTCIECGASLSDSDYYTERVENQVADGTTMMTFYECPDCGYDANNDA